MLISNNFLTSNSIKFCSKKEVSDSNESKIQGNGKIRKTLYSAAAAAAIISSAMAGINMAGKSNDDFSANGILAQEIETSADGKQVKEVISFSNGLEYSTESKYDANGNEISWSRKYPNGVQALTTYEYDASGNLIKKVETDEKGFQISVTREYDLKGNMLKETEKSESADGVVQFSMEHEYEYNANGDLVKKNTNYGLIDDFNYGLIEDFYSREFSYDNTGKLIKEVVIDSDGRQSPTYYEYDFRGNIIKFVTIDEDGGIKYSTTRKYDDNDKLIKQVVTSEDFGTFYTRFKYDDNGNLIKSNESNEHGMKISSITYNYDDNGNLIKEIKDLRGYRSIMFNKYDDQGNQVSSHEERTFRHGRKVIVDSVYKNNEIIFSVTVNSEGESSVKVIK